MQTTQPTGPQTLVTPAPGFQKSMDSELVGTVPLGPPLGSGSVTAVRMGFKGQSQLKPSVPRPILCPCVLILIIRKNSWPSQVLSEVYLMLGVHDDHVKQHMYVHNQRHDDRFITENSHIISLPEFTFILVIFK